MRVTHDDAQTADETAEQGNKHKVGLLHSLYVVETRVIPIRRLGVVGYHVRLTRARSGVRSSQATITFFFFLLFLFCGSLYLQLCLF